LHDVVVLCEADIFDGCGMLLQLGNDMDIFKVGGMNGRNSGNRKAGRTELDEDFIDALELGFDDPFRASNRDFAVARGRDLDIDFQELDESIQRYQVEIWIGCAKTSRAAGLSCEMIF
jgi:hypothetical protein